MDVAKFQNLLTELVQGQETALTVTKELEPDVSFEGRRLIIEQRALNPEAPPRPEFTPAEKRRHVFHDVPGFVRYLKKYGDGFTVLYADVPCETIHAVLSEASPLREGGAEILQMKPQPHPLFVPWQNLLSHSSVPLDQFVDFLLQNRRAVVKPEGRELALLFSQVKSSTRVELERGRGKRAINGITITTEIQGTHNNEFVELPDEMEIFVPLYVGGIAQEIAIDLTLETRDSGKQVWVGVSATGLAAAKVTAFEAMIAECQPLSEQKMVFCFGRPQYVAAETLEYIAEAHPMAAPR